MDTIKLANKILKEGIKLLPDDAKADFKTKLGDIFVDESISNACGMVNEDEEKIAMLTAWTVQEANRVVTTLWREGLLPEDLEKEYRKLPSMKECADAYNEFTADRKERMNKVMEEYNAIAAEEKDLDIFRGVINGLDKEQSERKYKEFMEQQKAAAERR